MPTVYFVRRTPSEIEIFGGTVYVEIDGLCVGEVGKTDLVVELVPGAHKIKMYKTHAYNSFIGFAEADILLVENKSLMVQYSPPMTITQSGHIVISNFSSMDEIEELIVQKEKHLQQEKATNDAQMQKRNEEIENSSKKLAFWFFVVPILFGIFYFVLDLLFIHSIFNLF